MIISESESEKLYELSAAEYTHTADSRAIV